MNIETKIDGMDALIVKLNNIKNYDATEPLRKLGLEIETDAKANCPVDTGTLRRSINSKVEDNVLTVGTNLEYAPYVEFGTGIYADKGAGRKDRWVYCSEDGEFYTTEGQKAQPFLLPAYEKNKMHIIKYIQEDIDKKI